MVDEVQNDVRDEVVEIGPFDPTKKKKKRKKVVFQDSPDDSADKLAEKTESLWDGLEGTFSGLKKKTKPVDTNTLIHDDGGDGGEDLDDRVADDVEERPHNYIFLGKGVTVIMNMKRENNPVLAGDRRRTVIRPPRVLHEGAKKTVFVNFMDLCKTMHCQPDRVMAFLLAELETSGPLDDNRDEYVICIGCKSPDTILTKENRLFFQRCEKRGSGWSVAPIKAGFVARVGRRNTGT